MQKVGIIGIIMAIGGAICWVIGLKLVDNYVSPPAYTHLLGTGGIVVALLGLLLFALAKATQKG